jgi:colanic acid biosynthesis glycosyl transferase WcaI
MKFILYSLNYSPELTGIGKYNGEMLPVLAGAGVDVCAIVAPPYYPEWEVPVSHSAIHYKRENVDGVDIIRCPLYVPKKVTMLKRLFHLSSFALSSGFALLSKVLSKPDVIFLVQPTLFCAPVTLLVAKLTGAKAVMHIQDFEIDAMFGLGMLGEGFFARFTRKIESFLLKRFDVVSSISYSMLDNAARKGVNSDRLLFFPNWADITFVNPEIDGSKLKHEFGFLPSDRVILYAGNIGAKQGLEIVLDAAQHYAAEECVKFVLVGAGAYVDELKAIAAERQLRNVYFKPLQTWERVPEMLTMADIHLVVQKKGAADAVLPSKLTNILAAGGHALVTAELGTELGQLTDKFPGIYELVDPESSSEFISGLERLLAKDLSRHNVIARDYAERYLDKTKILERLHQDLSELVQSK